MASPCRATAFLFLYTFLLNSQTPPREVSIRTHPYTPPSAILRAEANLVETGLTVRDSRGSAVAGLKAADLEVLDNGVPRQITAFSELRPATPSPIAAPAAAQPSEAVQCGSAASLQPRFVTFFFDDFHVDNGSMLFVRQGARAFIAKGIKPADHLSIVTASSQGDLDFTTDAKLFAERLDHIGSHTRPLQQGYCGVNAIDSYIFLHNLDGQIVEQAIGAAVKCAGCSAGEISAQCRSKAYSIAQSEASTMWEQLHAQSLDTLSALGFAAKRLSQMNGMRVLVLTSSGFLLRPGVPPELESFIDSALRWNIVVDAIGAQGLETRMGGPKDLLRRSLYSDPLANVAAGTGGHFFKDTNDLGGAMEFAADPEVSYVLAFNAGSPDGKFHTLKILFKSKRGTELQFRPGYFSPDPKAEKKAVSARSRMDDAVFSRQTLDEIPVNVTLGNQQPKDGAISVPVRLTVDMNTMQFTNVNGRHMQQIVFLTALLDPDSAFVSGEESIMEFALTDEKLASFKQTGLTAIATLNAHPGTFQLRAIVREGMKGNLSASTTPLELREK